MKKHSSTFEVWTIGIFPKLGLWNGVLLPFSVFFILNLLVSALCPRSSATSRASSGSQLLQGKLSLEFKVKTPVNPIKLR
jgi:hypothetical protein